jgi:hypothetical protein
VLRNYDCNVHTLTRDLTRNRMERKNFQDRMLVPAFQCTYSETVQMYSAVTSLR